MPVRTISSSTPDGLSSSWPRSERSEVRKRELGGVANWRLAALARISWSEWAQLLDDVVDGLDQPGSVADQSRWQPRLERLSAGPGTAKTSRFCSIAWRAVESEPLRGVASTTTTPRAMPGDDPVPLGKEPGQRRLPHGHLAERPRRTRPARGRGLRARADRSSESPLARTAIDRPPAASAPRWAAASMPRARPETTVNPVRASARREPLGHPFSVGRAAPRADQGDGQLVLRLDRSFHVKQDGRIGNVLERGGVSRVASRSRRVTPSRRQSASSCRGVEFEAGPADLPGELGPDATDRAELRLASRPGLLQPSRTAPAAAAGLRADPRHRRQLDQVEQSNFGVGIGQIITPCRP